MACLPSPSVEGVYRIKVKTQDRYIELDPSGRLKLVPREEAADGQLVCRPFQWGLPILITRLVEDYATQAQDI